MTNVEKTDIQPGDSAGELQWRAEIVMTDGPVWYL